MFSQYRKDWRNPSTHDHTLTFSEAEAFVAITSVTSFATVLCDEMLQRLAFRRAQTDPELHAFALALAASRENDPPVWKLGDALAHIGEHISRNDDSQQRSESHFVGLLAGLLAAIPGGLEVDTEPEIGPDRRHHPDLLVRMGDKTLVVDVKRAKATRASIGAAIDQVERFLSVAQLEDGVVFFVPQGKTKYKLFVHQRTGGQGYILVTHPAVGSKPAV